MRYFSSGFFPVSPATKYFGAVAFVMMTVSLRPDNIAHSHNTPGIHCLFSRRRIVPQKNALLSQVLLNASHEPSSFKCIDCDLKIQLVIKIQEITMRKPSGLRH